MTRASDPVDLHLLRVLCTLVAERSVSRTAIKLNQSQPAVSTALKRLREIFGDPLLVREGAAMIPTERAMQLRDGARNALAEIERLLRDPERFDPASTQLTFNVASPDYMAAGFLAGVAERMRRAAPGARLVVQPLGSQFDYEHALAEGEVDIVVGNWPTPPERLHLSLLLEDEIVCLVSARHAAAKKGMSAEQYLASAHVVPAPYSPSQRGVVETHLASLRLTRDARVTVPFFETAPYLLVDTDLVFTTARHFAEHFARVLPLAVVKAPLAFPPMRFYQLWHDRAQHQASHRWLRQLLGESARRLAKRA